jgi:SAC3 domain-containing protein 1
MEFSKEELIVGSCTGMCPDDEIKRRERSGCVHFFERAKGCEFQRRPRADRNKMVKEFSRPAAGKDDIRCTDLRPADVLVKTTIYLVDEISSVSSQPFYKVYHFVFDRLRAVRQDLVIQRINNTDAIHILEMTVRFLVYSSYKLCEESLDNFDPHINNTHLQECLKRLLVLYSSPDVCRCHQAEFVSIYVLINLGSSEALMLGLQLKSQLSGMKDFDLALKISLAWSCRNYVRVLRLVRSADFLPACSFHRHIRQIQCTSLQVMNAAFAGKNLTYPLSRLTELLALYSDDETTKLCSECRINVQNGCVSFAKNKFSLPSKILLQRCEWIERLASGSSTSKILKSQPLCCCTLEKELTS